MTARTALYLESGIREPFDAPDLFTAAEPPSDMAQVAARAIVNCVVYRLGLQDRFAGAEKPDREIIVHEVADIVRRHKAILEERTTDLMSGTTVSLKPQDQQSSQKFMELRDFLETPGRKAAFKKVAHGHLKVDRLLRLVLSAASRNPKILECSQQSVLQFTMQCSETGLEPIGPGGSYPIPRYNKTTRALELTFQPDYRGLLNCARRAGCVKDAFADVVHANDKFDYQTGLEQKLEHKPALCNRGDMIAAYCVLVMPDDSRRVVMMNREEIEHIRNTYSESWKADGVTPWKTMPGEMWKKTVVIRAMKPFKGMSPALHAAMDAEPEEEDSGAVAELPSPIEEPAHVKPITKAQTKAINDLLAKLDLPADEVESILGGDVAALTEVQADAVRDKLLQMAAAQSKE